MTEEEKAKVIDGIKKQTQQDIKEIAKIRNVSAADAIGLVAIAYAGEYLESLKKDIELTTKH